MKKGLKRILSGVFASACITCATLGIAFTADHKTDVYAEEIKKAYEVTKAESTVAYGADELTGAVGVVASLAANDTLTLNNVINLNEFSQEGKSFIQFMACTHEKYSAEYTQIFVEMVDVYDHNNYVTVKISADPQLEDTSLTSYFLACASNGQKPTGYESSANKIHVNNVYGQWSPFSYAGVNGANSYTGLYYNVDEKAIYAVSDMGVKKMIIDFDDPRFFGTTLWDGFTSNEVYCRIRCANYKRDKANLLLMKYGDYDLKNEEMTDAVAPVITVNYGEYTKNNLPKALLDHKYPVFHATAFDAVDGVLDVEVKAYLNYYSKQKMELDIKKGAFTPEFSGAPHYLVYTVTDAYGNKAEEVVVIDVVSSCDPIAITFTEHENTKVAGDLYRLPAYEITGGLGNVALTVSVTLNGEPMTIENKGVRPFNEGALVITYDLVDYIGQTYSTTVVEEIAEATKPTFIETPILPKYLVAGNVYRLPKLSAYNYVTASGEKIETSISVVENGNTKEIDEVYVPSDVSHAEIIYTAKIGDMVGEYRVGIPVYKTSDSEGIQMEKYFLCDGNATAVASSKSIDLIATANAEVEFLNALIASSFRTEFVLGEDYSGLKKLTISLTDIAREEKTLTFTYLFQGKTLSFYLNGEENGAVGVEGTASAGMKFSLQLDMMQKQVSYDIANDFVLPVTCFANGDSYDGFTDGLAYVTYEMEVSNTASIGIQKINGHVFNDKSVEKIKPMIAWEGDTGGQYTIGKTLKLPKIIANDVLSGSVDAYVTITMPNDQIAKNAFGQAMKDFLYDGSEIEILLTEYGDYKIVVKATDASGNTTTSNLRVSVVDKEKPQMTINGNVVETAKVGDKIILPKATATDNYATPTISVYVVCAGGNTYLFENGENVFIANQAGIYTVVYTVSDDMGNFVSEYYSITVEEGSK
ncbi:MAG: hypothetical protein IJX30_02405 [Clostridia bacterium]|nr:hypothetical protein [Clostridia bacterium]